MCISTGLSLSSEGHGNTPGPGVTQYPHCTHVGTKPACFSIPGTCWPNHQQKDYSIQQRERRGGLETRRPKGVEKNIYLIHFAYQRI